MTKNVWRIFCLLLLVGAVSGCDRYADKPQCGPSLAQAPMPDWQLDAQGMGIQAETGLRWFRCNAGERFVGGTCTGNALQLNLNDALAYVDDFSRASGRTWRLPTLKEMASLRQSRCHNPAIDTRVFPSVRVDHYWAATQGGPNVLGLACSFYTFNGAGYCREMATNKRPFWLVLEE